MAWVCVLEGEPRINSFGFQRKKDFLFSVKTPCVGLVCSLSVIPPSSLDWPNIFPQGPYLRYSRWLAALGICAIPVILSSRLIFGLNFAFLSWKKISASPICCHVNIVERRALSLSLIKAVTSELHIFQYLLKNKNIICHCSINYKFISLFSYSWIIKMT